MSHVVVVGAGLGGLATAIRLRAAGVDVTLLEREDHPGGRAGRLQRDGFTFDTGPSVMTMPAMIDELFALAGENRADHLTFTQLDPAYRAVYHDGSELRVRAGVETMIEEVRTVCGAAEADRFRRFAEHLRKLYEAEFDTFIDANFDSVLDLAKPGPMLRLVRLGGFRRVMPLVSSFLTDWRLIRLFTFQSMYAGMSPYEALGLYAIIAYMDAVEGVFFSPGGIHAVPRALADLAIRMGVDIRLSAEVEQVEIVGGRAVAVRSTAGDRVAADVVVLNPDLPVAYNDLLGPGLVPRRVKTLKYSPSCVVVHLGLSAKLAGDAHHNIHFAEGYEKSFTDILSGRLQSDPSWFLTVPTRGDPTMAPAGGDVAFSLLPCPNLKTAGGSVNWPVQAERELEAVVTRLEAAGYGPIRDAVVTSDVVTPAYWARKGMAAGTPFAASHHFRQTGPFRPKNVAPTVDGVVFVGSSTTPGVGIPMVLVSGRLAAARAQELLTKRLTARSGHVAR